MSDVLDEQARDRRGRWLKGTKSPNPAGRPRGSKSRTYRRRADPARAAEWSAQHWHAFYQRSFQEAEGAPAEKHGAAFSESMALWLSLNRPPHHPGLCAQCGKPLDVPLSSISAAPIQVHGAWTHWGCAPWFCHARWHSAKAALRQLGISENTV
jgi:hypothetical protein